VCNRSGDHLRCDFLAEANSDGLEIECSDPGKEASSFAVANIDAFHCFGLILMARWSRSA